MTVNLPLNSLIQAGVFSQARSINEELGKIVRNLAGGLKTNGNVADISVGYELKYQSNALNAAVGNAAQGKSLSNTAKGGLDKILDLLDQQKSLAVRANDASLTDNQRAALNTEFQALSTEIGRIVSDTTFNNKVLLDGSISGGASITTATGQATENYTLLTTSDFSFSGTTASPSSGAGLATSSVFSVVESDSIGKTAGSTTLDFTGNGSTVTNAVVTIEGGTVTFSATTPSDAEIAAAFIAAAEASTNADVRKFVYTDNEDGTVTVTTADLGDTDNAIEFSLTTDGTNITAFTVGGEDADATDSGAAQALTAGTGTAGTDRTVASADKLLDADLQGAITGLTTSLDTTGTQNAVTFTATVNGKTFTSQAVTLFGTGGFNSKGNTIKSGQVITFYDTAGAKDSSDEFVESGFTLTVDSTDITISGGTQTLFEDDLQARATIMNTQLSSNLINQSRDIVLSGDSTNAYEIVDAEPSVLDGLQTFDADGTNVKGDIQLVSNTFGDAGGHGTIGPFSFNSSTHTLSTTINGEVFSADISDTTASTGGRENNTGDYNTTTKTLTTNDGEGGNGEILVLHSASTTDGRQLRIDLTNVDQQTISLDTTTNIAVFTDALDAIFNVDDASSLAFQVGQDSTDTITLAIDSAATADIYLDDSGVSQTLDISTTTGASTASDIIDNAVDNVNAIRAAVIGKIDAFESVITVNGAIADELTQASNLLLNTDFAEDAAKFAELQIRVQSLSSIIAQVNANAQQSISKLLG